MANLNLQDRIGDGVHRHVVEASYLCHITGKVIHRLSSRSLTDSRETKLVETYLEDLNELGLQDTTSSRDYMARAKELKAEVRRARHAAPTDALREMGVALGSGEISVAEASKQLPKIVTPDQAEELTRARVKVLNEGRHEAVRLAMRALHDAGDRLVLEVLRPLVERCLASPDVADNQAAYNRARAMHRKLLGWAIPAAEEATPPEYAFRRPDLVHAWRLEHAEQAKEITRWRRKDGTFAIAFAPIGAPHPTLEVIAKHAGEWGPSLYTGAQVIENWAVFKTT